MMRTANAFKKVTPVKPAHFVGTSLEDLRKLPEDVQHVFGKSIQKAQWGGKAANTKPLKGYIGAGVLEISEEHDGNAYRAVYTTRMPRAIYVLHAFEKKSTQGIRTPQKHIDIVNARLRIAEADYEQRYTDKKQDTPRAR
jgi:phage-related protein